MENIKPKAYQGEGFEVTYDKDVCTHAGVCVKTLPQVFNPKERPWIKTNAASKEEIRDMIKNCPSGALQFHDKE